MWESSASDGPLPFPRIRATRFARSGTFAYQLELDARVLEIGLQQLRRARLVPRRVDGVDPDELPQELDDGGQSDSFAYAVRRVPDLAQLGEEPLLHEPAEHLDRRPLRADDLVADHPRDDLVVADAPGLRPLVELHQRLGELVQLLVLPPRDVERAQVEAALAEERVELLAERRRPPAQLAAAGRVEARAVTEDAADLLVLPRRHPLEHVELRGHIPQAEVRPAEQPQRRSELAALELPRGELRLLRGELQPQLRGLVDGLEQELVVVRPLLRPLLQPEQLVGAEVALVVACAFARQDGCECPRRPRGSILPA